MNPAVSRRSALKCLCGGVAAALPLGFRPAGAQPPQDPAFAALARRHGFERGGPGVAVFVGRPPQRGSFYCFGAARLSGEPIAPRTIFELASVSKTITSTAALMLCERNELSLADDVRKHVTEIPEYNEKRPIRIEDLLRHVSGLPDYMSFADVPAKNDGFHVNDDYVAEFARQKDTSPLAFPTGRKHVYNNTNYMLLATVISRVAKKPYGVFLREAIFEPAGMRDTFVYDAPSAVPDGAEKDAALGYVREDGSWKDAWGLPPARRETLLTVGDGGIWSSVRDMAAWDAALHSGKFISAETAKQVLSPTKTPDGESHGYGMGWGLYYRDAGVMYGYGHNGGWGGFVTSYCHEPDVNLTTVILSNRGDFDIDKFWYDMRDLVRNGRLGGDPGRGRRRPPR